MRFVIFLIVAGSILGTGYSFVGWRLFHGLNLTSSQTRLAWVILLSFPVFHIFSFSLHLARLQGKWLDYLQWVNFLLLGLFSLLFAATVLREFAWLTARLIDVISSWVSSGSFHILPVDKTERLTWFRGSSIAVIWLVLVGFGIGVYQALSQPKVVTVDVPIANLHPDLEGFKIVQITDIHVGPTIQKKQVREIVDIANDQKGDVIVFTGDLVDGSVSRLREHTAPMGKLVAPYGVYFVTGNHEYYSGVKDWLAEVTRLGMRVLSNEHDIIEHGSARLLMAGVPDYNGISALKDIASDPVASVAEANPHDLKVLLAHQPRSYKEALKAGFDLQLSGHTHGGQFWPWKYLIPLQQPFTSGLNRIPNGNKDMWLYVSTGSGYWGPPLRLGIPHEVAVIRLVSG